MKVTEKLAGTWQQRKLIINEEQPLWSFVAASLTERNESVPVRVQVADCVSAEEALPFWDYITRISVMRSRWARVVRD